MKVRLHIIHDVQLGRLIGYIEQLAESHTCHKFTIASEYKVAPWPNYMLKKMVKSEYCTNYLLVSGCSTISHCIFVIALTQKVSSIEHETPRTLRAISLIVSRKGS